MMGRLRAFVAFILAPSGFVPAQLYSPVNRISLSYEYSDSLRAAVTGGGRAFFSRPSDWRFAPPRRGFSIREKERSAGAGFGVVAAGSAAGGQGAGFGAWNGIFTLQSGFLDAKVDLNVYSAGGIAEEFPDEILYERFIVGAERPITGVFDFRFGLKEAYLTLKKGPLSVDIGKRKLRWGPGYKGTLALSGTTFAPLYYYHIVYGFGERVRLSAFLCGYEDEERFARELKPGDSIVVAATGMSLSTLPPRFGTAQRFDIRLGSHVQLGLFEMVNFFGANELNRFANPLSFYYVGNNASGTNNANMMGGGDCNVVFSRYRFYGEFLNDDITVFEQAGNPDKYAFQIGAQMFPGPILMQAGLEYSHITRYVYGHFMVLSRHTLWDEAIGWPWGNDQDVVSSHAIFNVSAKLRMKIEANFWLKGKGKLTDEWYADGSPDLDNTPYWPRNPDRALSCMMALQYRPAEWVTADCMYTPVVDNGAVRQRAFGFLTIALPGKSF